MNHINGWRNNYTEILSGLIQTDFSYIYLYSTSFD